MAGRCIPAFVSDVIDEAEELGDTLRDKYNQTVNSEDVDEGSEYET